MKLKFIMIFTGITFFVSLISGVFSYVNALDRADVNKKETAQADLKAIKSHVEFLLTSESRVVTQLATQERLRNLIEGSQEDEHEYAIESLLRDAISMNDTVLALYVGTAGDEMIEPNGEPLPEGYHPTERPWYVGAVAAKGELYITAPYVSEGDENAVITIS